MELKREKRNLKKFVQVSQIRLKTSLKDMVLKLDCKSLMNILKEESLTEPLEAIKLITYLKLLGCLIRVI